MRLQWNEPQFKPQPGNCFNTTAVMTAVVSVLLLNVVALVTLVTVASRLTHNRTQRNTEHLPSLRRRCSKSLHDWMKSVTTIQRNTVCCCVCKSKLRYVSQISTASRNAINVSERAVLWWVFISSYSPKSRTSPGLKRKRICSKDLQSAEYKGGDTTRWRQELAAAESPLWCVLSSPLSEEKRALEHTTMTKSKLPTNTYVLRLREGK